VKDEKFSKSFTDNMRCPPVDKSVHLVVGRRGFDTLIEPNQKT